MVKGYRVKVHFRDELQPRYGWHDARRSVCGTSRHQYELCFDPYNQKLLTTLHEMQSQYQTQCTELICIEEYDCLAKVDARMMEITEVMEQLTFELDQLADRRSLHED